MLKNQPTLHIKKNSFKPSHGHPIKNLSGFDLSHLNIASPIHDYNPVELKSSSSNEDINFVMKKKSFKKSMI